MEIGDEMFHNVIYFGLWESLYLRLTKEIFLIRKIDDQTPGEGRHCSVSPYKVDHMLQVLHLRPPEPHVSGGPKQIFVI